MLPAQQRLRRPAEFSVAVRRGRRSGRRHLVVHAVPGATAPVRVPEAGTTARLGLVVSSAVGGSVVRHRVARRLRHVAAPLLVELPAGTDVVLRALPTAAGASSAELAVDVRAGLRRLGLLGGRG